jgi:hypothetical protein
MGKCLNTILRLKPAVLTGIFLLNAAGCGSMNLGQIDESEDPREFMPGPGVFSNNDGDTSLKWSSGDKQPSTKPEQASSLALDEKTEFEEFKIWNKLRTKGVESEEYQEFLQWLNYQKFKTGQ